VDWGAAAALLNEVAIGLAASAGEGTDFVGFEQDNYNS